MCMLDYDDGDSQILGESIRRAAVEHRCGECGRAISPGEHYRVVRGVWERSSFWVTKQCAHCIEVTRWLSHACGGFVYQACCDDVWGHIDGDEWEERTWPLMRLGLRMNRDWKRRDGTLWPIGDVVELADRAIVATNENRIHRRVMPGPVKKRTST